MRERQVPRGDGRLTDDLDPQDRGPQDACGVFGVWAPEEEVAKLTYFGLFALQHRGQEAAGIAVSDGSGVVVYKDLGLVSQVFDEPTLASLRGHLAIGHTRYSTTGGSSWGNAQPTIRATTAGTTIALAHNGNLVNTAELAREVAERGPEADLATSDTALVTTLLASRPDLSSRPRPSRCSRACAARSASSSWTRARCTPLATPTVSARWCWAGWNAAGWSPARPRRWTSWVPASCVRWSRARCSRSTSTGCAPPGSPRPSPRAASSSTSTWPARTPRSPAATCTRRGWRSAAGSPGSIRSRPIWSSRSRSRA